MAISAKWYGLGLLNALGGSAGGKCIDWKGHTIKVMLCTGSYIPNQDTHETKSHVANEASGNGYTAGGIALTGKTATYAESSNIIKLDAADIAWPNSNITARYAVIYDNTGATDAEKLLLGYVDFGEEKTSSGGDFTIPWSVNGILRITAS